jgi:hypothetical protein
LPTEKATGGRGCTAKGRVSNQYQGRGLRTAVAWPMTERQDGSQKRELLYYFLFEDYVCARSSTSFAVPTRSTRTVAAIARAWIEKLWLNRQRALRLQGIYGLQSSRPFNCDSTVCPRSKYASVRLRSVPGSRVVF